MSQCQSQRLGGLHRHGHVVIHEHIVLLIFCQQHHLRPEEFISRLKPTRLESSYSQQRSQIREGITGRGVEELDREYTFCLARHVEGSAELLGNKPLV